MTRAASETDFDYKDIDTMETALLVGAERIKYLPEPFEEERWSPGRRETEEGLSRAT